jgi:uncharacterized protein YyaL (SSP411 family)
MFDARSKRVRPHLDDKVLASWNGMMLGAWPAPTSCWAMKRYRAAAEKNLVFCRSKLWDAPNKTLYHRWREGGRDSVQLLTRLRQPARGNVSIFTKPRWNPGTLDFALALAETMLAKFYDAKDGGFYDSAAEKRI